MVLGRGLAVLCHLLQFGNRSEARVEFPHEITIESLSILEKLEILTYKLADLNVFSSTFLAEL